MAIEISKPPVVKIDPKRNRLIAAVAKGWADDIKGFVEVLTNCGYTDHEILAGIFAFFPREETNKWVIVVKKEF